MGEHRPAAGRPGHGLPGKFVPSIPSHLTVRRLVVIGKPPGSCLITTSRTRAGTRPGPVTTPRRVARHDLGIAESQECPFGRGYDSTCRDQHHNDGSRPDYSHTPDIALIMRSCRYCRHHCRGDGQAEGYAVKCAREAQESSCGSLIVLRHRGGKIPAAKVLETDRIPAFRDINPRAPTRRP